MYGYNNKCVKWHTVPCNVVGPITVNSWKFSATVLTLQLGT